MSDDVACRDLLEEQQQKSAFDVVTFSAPVSSRTVSITQQQRSVYGTHNNRMPSYNTYSTLRHWSKGTGYTGGGGELLAFAARWHVRSTTWKPHLSDSLVSLCRVQRRQIVRIHVVVSFWSHYYSRRLCLNLRRAGTVTRGRGTYPPTIGVDRFKSTAIKVALKTQHKRTQNTSRTTSTHTL